MFNWETKYAIGHAEVDSQHQDLIAVMNHLYELLTSAPRDVNSQAERIINELALHVSTHFAYEEDLMVRIGYPTEKIAQHAAIHNDMLAKVQSIVAAHRSGDARALEDLLPLLYGEWLIDHICEKDMDFSGYL
ncbi:MAG: hemerythrin family protein [Betaproteobacteria bacterium]|nr:hemerythrin family protein [Betaproteobacteria bacterium]